MRMKATAMEKLIIIGCATERVISEKEKRKSVLLSELNSALTLNKQLNAKSNRSNQVFKFRSNDYLKNKWSNEKPKSASAHIERPPQGYRGRTVEAFHNLQNNTLYIES